MVDLLRNPRSSPLERGLTTTEMLTYPEETTAGKLFRCVWGATDEADGCGELIREIELSSHLQQHMDQDYDQALDLDHSGHVHLGGGAWSSGTSLGLKAGHSLGIGGASGHGKPVFTHAMVDAGHTVRLDMDSNPTTILNGTKVMRVVWLTPESTCKDTLVAVVGVEEHVRGVVSLADGSAFENPALHSGIVRYPSKAFKDRVQVKASFVRKQTAAISKEADKAAKKAGSTGLKLAEAADADAADPDAADAATAAAAAAAAFDAGEGEGGAAASSGLQGESAVCLWTSRDHGGLCSCSFPDNKALEAHIFNHIRQECSPEYPVFSSLMEERKSPGTYTVSIDRSDIPHLVVFKGNQWRVRWIGDESNSQSSLKLIDVSDKLGGVVVLSDDSRFENPGSGKSGSCIEFPWKDEMKKSFLTPEPGFYVKGKETNWSDLPGQIGTHGRDKAWKCRWWGCSRHFSERSKFVEHVRLQHTQFKPYRCSAPDCSKLFPTLDMLKKHLRHHLVAPASKYRHVCSVTGCLAAFTCTADLDEHRLKHEQREHRCAEAGCKWCFVMEQTVDFKQALTQARLRRKMTQAQLAHSIHENETDINHFESGRRQPTDQVFDKLCQVLRTKLPHIKPAAARSAQLNMYTDTERISELYCTRVGASVADDPEQTPDKRTLPLMATLSAVVVISTHYALSDEQVEICRHVFQEIDRDDSGNIRPNEMVKALNKGRGLKGLLALQAMTPGLQPLHTAGHHSPSSGRRTSLQDITVGSPKSPARPGSPNQARALARAEAQAEMFKASFESSLDAMEQDSDGLMNFKEFLDFIAKHPLIPALKQLAKKKKQLAKKTHHHDAHVHSPDSPSHGASASQGPHASAAHSHASAAEMALNAASHAMHPTGDRVVINGMVHVMSASRPMPAEENNADGEDDTDHSLYSALEVEEEGDPRGEKKTIGSVEERRRARGAESAHLQGHSGPSGKSTFKSGLTINVNDNLNGPGPDDEVKELHSLAHHHEQLYQASVRTAGGDAHRKEEVKAMEKNIIDRIHYMETHSCAGRGPASQHTVDAKRKKLRDALAEPDVVDRVSRMDELLLSLSEYIKGTLPEEEKRKAVAHSARSEEDEGTTAQPVAQLPGALALPGAELQASGNPPSGVDLIGNGTTVRMVMERKGAAAAAAGERGGRSKISRPGTAAGPMSLPTGSVGGVGAVHGPGVGGRVSANDPTAAHPDKTLIELRKERSDAALAAAAAANPRRKVKVSVAVRCHGLRTTDRLSKSDPSVVMFVGNYSAGGKLCWTETGPRTECLQDDEDPVFRTRLEIVARGHGTRCIPETPVKLCVYDIDDATLVKLKDEDLIGSCETDFASMLGPAAADSSARGAGGGYAKKGSAEVHATVGCVFRGPLTYVDGAGRHRKRLPAGAISTTVEGVHISGGAANVHGVGLKGDEAAAGDTGGESGSRLPPQQRAATAGRSRHQQQQQQQQHRSTNVTHWNNAGEAYGPVHSGLQNQHAAGDLGATPRAGVEEHLTAAPMTSIKSSMLKKGLGTGGTPNKPLTLRTKERQTQLAMAQRLRQDEQQGQQHGSGGGAVNSHHHLDHHRQTKTNDFLANMENSAIMADLEPIDMLRELDGYGDDDDLAVGVLQDDDSGDEFDAGLIRAGGSSGLTRGGRAGGGGGGGGRAGRRSATQQQQQQAGTGFGGSFSQSSLQIRSTLTSSGYSMVPANRVVAGSQPRNGQFEWGTGHSAASEAEEAARRNHAANGSRSRPGTGAAAAAAGGTALPADHAYSVPAGAKVREYRGFGGGGGGAAAAGVGQQSAGRMVKSASASSIRSDVRTGYRPGSAASATKVSSFRHVPGSTKQKASAPPGAGQHHHPSFTPHGLFSQMPPAPSGPLGRPPPPPPQQQQQQQQKRFYQAQQQGYDSSAGGLEGGDDDSMPRLMAVPLKKWTNTHVLRWLSALHLGQYSSAFERARTDGYMLVSTSDAQLEQRFGITNKYHRRKIHLNASLLKQHAVMSSDSRTTFDAEVAVNQRDGVGHH